MNFVWLLVLTATASCAAGTVSPVASTEGNSSVVSSTTPLPDVKALNVSGDVVVDKKALPVTENSTLVPTQVNASVSGDIIINNGTEIPLPVTNESTQPPVISTTPGGGNGSSTTTKTTQKPTATTSKVTNPTEPTTSPTAKPTTLAPLTTPSPPGHQRHFDGPSFVGGIILALGLVSIAFVAFKFYKARSEMNYHTL